MLTTRLRILAATSILALTLLPLHASTPKFFQSATQSPQMPQEFKEFAATALSTLEDHREQAQQLVNKTRS